MLLTFCSHFKGFLFYSNINLAQELYQKKVLVDECCVLTRPPASSPRRCHRPRRTNGGMRPVLQIDVNR